MDRLRTLADIAERSGDVRRELWLCSVHLAQNSASIETSCKDNLFQPEPCMLNLHMGASRLRMTNLTLCKNISTLADPEQGG